MRILLNYYFSHKEFYGKYFLIIKTDGQWDISDQKTS